MASLATAASLSALVIIALCILQSAAYSSYRNVKTSTSVTRLYKKIYHNDDGTFDITSAPMLDFNENYYRVMGVDSNAPPKVIKKQFLKQIFQYHPDRISKDDENAEELIALRNQQTMVINSAYRILKDVTMRAEYDMRHREPVRVKSSTSSGGFGASKERVALTAEEIEQKAQDKAIQDELKKELKREGERKRKEEKEKAEQRKASERSSAASKKAGRAAKPVEPEEPSLRERFPDMPQDLLEIYKDDFSK